MDRIARETAEKYGPKPTTPVEALNHVVAVFADSAAYELVITATSGIYDTTSGLTHDDLRLLAKRDARLTEFARRIVALDDVDGPGAEERRTVTLNRIIGWAQAALGETGPA